MLLDLRSFTWTKKIPASDVATIPKRHTTCTGRRSSRAGLGGRTGRPSLLGIWRLRDHGKRGTPVIEVASGGGVASTGLELAFLCLIAINLAVLLFLRQVQGQLLQNDHALLQRISVWLTHIA